MQTIQSAHPHIKAFFPFYFFYPIFDLFIHFFFYNRSQQISEDEFKKECYRLAFYMEMVDEFREEWCLSTKDDEFFLGLDCIFKIRKGKLCIKRATQDGFLKTTRENYKIMIEYG